MSTITNVIRREQPFPGFAYISGLTTYDEALINGRWVGRCWTANGFIASERDLAWIPDNAQKPVSAFGLDLHAFWIEVDGQALHWGWEAGESGVEEQGPQSCHAWIDLRNTLRLITVRVHTVVDGTGLLMRWLDITNTGEQPAALGAAYPFTGIINLLSAGLTTRAYRQQLREPQGEPQPVWSLGYMAESEWGNEGAFAWLPLPSTPVRIESRLGKSGFGAPFFVLRNDETGEHVIGGLAWSGSWAIEFTYAERKMGQDNSALGIKAGPTGAAPLRVIAPGEMVHTPVMHLGVLFADFDGCIQTWHEHLRRSVLPEPPAERKLLVCYDHWSYIEHEVSEEILRHEIDLAAEVGAEVFTVDAGWYGDKDTNWWRTVGNWRAGNRLPRGLEPVFDYAREKGLLCGLWFDCERAGAESDVAREHPDWFLSYYGRPSDELDLTNPVVQQWLEESLTRVIGQYRLDLFRLDYNTAVYEGGQTLRDGYWENSRWRYYEFINGLYGRLEQRFPGIILENCAGGGGRTDLGMLGRFHYTQVTDWPLLPRAARILNGMSMALPPDRFLFWTGVGQAGNLMGDLDAQMRLAVLTHFGVSGVIPSAEERNEALIGRIQRHVEVYKRHIRPILADCRVYHHTPVLMGNEPQGWCVLEYVAPDATSAAIGLFRLTWGDDYYRVYPRGIDPGRRYRVTSDNRGQSYERAGDELMNQGIQVAVGHALGSELLILEAV